MAVGIYTNLYKDKDLSVTKAVIELLDNSGIEFYIDENLKPYFPSCKAYDDKSFRTLKMLITVGGDGTILMVGIKCMKNNVPILGINKGTIGFLNEIELSGLEQIVNIIKNDDYKIDRRALLCTEYDGKVYYSLNESIVYRSDTKMITVDVKIEDKLVDKYSCDGFIVCTPTGSTAYSLSAGGPVMSPSADAMCLTPINSHSLHTRPIVIGGGEKVKIEVVRAYEDATLIVDGVEETKITLGKELLFYKSDCTLTFIRLSGSNFYEKLLSKLNIWGLTEN